MGRAPERESPQSLKENSLLARLGAVAALLTVLAAVAAGALEIERHIRHTPIKPRAIVNVVIPEGYTRAQIAQRTRREGLRGDYSKAVEHATQLRPSRYGAPAHERSLEGFLFPATYQMYAGAPVAKLVAAQLEAFTQSFGDAQDARARALGVSPYELLIIASIIEREAALPHERSLVAAVIYNRLRLHMRLGIDATLRYALHDFTHQLTERQLRSSSPYNTRTHTGLPPTPISNPGRAAIEAAGHPAHVSYLYYVARADGCLGQVFSTGYAQFQHDAAAYQKALARNHGRVPACPKR